MTDKLFFTNSKTKIAFGDVKDGNSVAVSFEYKGFWIVFGVIQKIRSGDVDIPNQSFSINIYADKEHTQRLSLSPITSVEDAILLIDVYKPIKHILDEYRSDKLYTNNLNPKYEKIRKDYGVKITMINPIEYLPKEIEKIRPLQPQHDKK